MVVIAVDWQFTEIQLKIHSGRLAIMDTVQLCTVNNISLSLLLKALCNVPVHVEYNYSVL